MQENVAPLPQHGHAVFVPKVGTRKLARPPVSTDASTRITYALEHGDGRGVAERELGDLQRLVDAFATWLTTTT